MGITAQIRRLAGSCVAATARGFVSSYENTERFFFHMYSSEGELSASVETAARGSSITAGIRSTRAKRPTAM